MQYRYDPLCVCADHSELVASLPGCDCLHQSILTFRVLVADTFWDQQSVKLLWKITISVWITSSSVNWDQLDIDSVLGELTDNNDEDLGPESEWDFSTDNELPAVNVVDIGYDDVETVKENTPKPKKPRSPLEEKKHFFCPLCSKSYLSTAGFRGMLWKNMIRPIWKVSFVKIC